MKQAAKPLMDAETRRQEQQTRLQKAMSDIKARASAAAEQQRILKVELAANPGLPGSAERTSQLYRGKQLVL